MKENQQFTKFLQEKNAQVYDKQEYIMTKYSDLFFRLTIHR